VFQSEITRFRFPFCSWCNLYHLQSFFVAGNRVADAAGVWGAFFMMNRKQRRDGRRQNGANATQIKSNFSRHLVSAKLARCRIEIRILRWTLQPSNIFDSQTRVVFKRKAFIQRGEGKEFGTDAHYESEKPSSLKRMGEFHDQFFLLSNKKLLPHA